MTQEEKDALERLQAECDHLASENLKLSKDRRKRDHQWQEEISAKINDMRKMAHENTNEVKGLCKKVEQLHISVFGVPGDEEHSLVGKISRLEFTEKQREKAKERQRALKLTLLGVVVTGVFTFVWDVIKTKLYGGTGGTP